MIYQIATLQLSDVHLFWPVFSRVLKSEFPGYTPKVVQYFLEKIYTQASYIYWLRNNLKTVLAAKDQEKIVGFAVIDEPYGGVSFLRWLGISKEYQKKGIGTKLIEKWIVLAKVQQCHKVEVAAQEQAKGFYEKAGFEFEGRRKVSYFGIMQCLFGKVLKQPEDDSMIRK